MEQIQNKNIKYIQQCELDILKSAINVFKKYNLKYYIVGGTLIGAVRHKGFIPWDDDMDIAMPREDYEKFLKQYYNELPPNIKINHFIFDEDVYFYPMKLMNTDIQTVEKRLEGLNCKTYLSIDVFPIDGLPNNIIRRLIYKLRFYYYKLLIGFANIDRLRNNIKRPVYEKIIINIAQLFKFNKIFKLNKIRIKFDKFLKKYTYDDCELIGDITGRYGFKEFVPKEYFGDGQEVDFENERLIAPSKMHEYLNQIYGDYMKLPPKEKQISDHIKLV